MTKIIQTTCPTPEQVERNNKLLDFVKTTLKLKSDAALCRALGVLPPTISKIRHGKLPVSYETMVAIHEEAGIPFSTIRIYVPKPTKVAE